MFLSQEKNMCPQSEKLIYRKRIFRYRKLPLQIQVLLAKCRIHDYQTYAELEEDMAQVIKLTSKEGVISEIIEVESNNTTLLRSMERTKFYARTQHKAFRYAIIHILNTLLNHDKGKY